MKPEGFLRGNVFAAGGGVVPYPRARFEEFSRLPIDTWTMAKVPVGVRLEFVGDARSIEVEYTTATDNLGYRGEGAGTTFTLWRDRKKVSEQRARLGSGRVTLECGTSDERAIVYLPEGMLPEIHAIEAVEGAIEPAPPQARWICYGDSVAEGWIACEPALAWPAIVGREHRLDIANLGYAGAARGETVSAENISELEADVISITHGTNCWTRLPFSTGLFREQLVAFLEVVRQGHPETPILVASPIVRPDAEETPNRLGATLADLRQTMEDVVGERIASGDANLELVAGRDLVSADQLGDGIHPNDDGHRALAAALGPAIRRLAERSRVG